MPNLSPQQTSESDYSFFNEASSYVRAGSDPKVRVLRPSRKPKGGRPAYLLGAEEVSEGMLSFHVDPSLNTLAYCIVLVTKRAPIRWFDCRASVPRGDEMVVERMI